MLDTKLKLYNLMCSQVRLVVVDSLAFPFRSGILNSLLRTRVLCDIMQELKMVAVRCNVAVSIRETAVCLAPDDLKSFINWIFTKAHCISLFHVPAAPSTNS